MKLTLQLALVLDAFLNGASYGFEIIDRTGLGAGTVYPILRRLEEAGLVRSEWEAAAVGREEGRPSRRLYVLTPDGTDKALQARVRHAAIFERGRTPGTEPAR